MRKKKAMRIGGKLYKTKTSLRAAVKQIFDTHPIGKVTNKELDAMLRDLFSHHPNAAYKFGPGVESIHVRTSTRNPRQRQFALHRKDGEIWDISVYECITASSPQRIFNKGCRYAIREQILSFRQAAFADRAQIPSELSGTMMTSHNSHVDHDEPQFAAIIKSFCANKPGFDVKAVKYTNLHPTVDDGRVVFSDQTFAQEFQEHHANVAKLRMITAQENLCRKRS
jgi:hypothetical protein